jgi:hypothetical protein
MSGFRQFFIRFGQPEEIKDQIWDQEQCRGATRRIAEGAASSVGRAGDRPPFP